jgi:uncharacterized protein (UPF0333 family)
MDSRGQAALEYLLLIAAAVLLAALVLTMLSRISTPVMNETENKLNQWLNDIG